MKSFIKDYFMSLSMFHSVFLAAGIILLTIAIAEISRKILNKLLVNSSDTTKSAIKQYAFLKHLSTALIYICGISVAIYLIPSLRNLSISIFAGSGILAVIIGFASQHSIANIVSGIFITVFKPFSVGDRIKMMGKDITGEVEDITLRHTVIRTFENKRIIIPNAVVSTEVVENSNIVESKICKYVEIGISYDSNIDIAMDIMRDEAMKHPEVIDNRSEEDKLNNEPIVAIRVIGFGDSSVNLRAWVWSKDQTTAFKMGCDLNKAIKERFDKEGIEIPFPHRTVVYKK